MCAPKYNLRLCYKELRAISEYLSEYRDSFFHIDYIEIVAYQVFRQERVAGLSRDRLSSRVCIYTSAIINFHNKHL